MTAATTTTNDAAPIPDGTHVGVVVALSREEARVVAVWPGWPVAIALFVSAEADRVPKAPPISASMIEALAEILGRMRMDETTETVIEFERALQRYGLAAQGHDPADFTHLTGTEYFAGLEGSVLIRAAAEPDGIHRIGAVAVPYALAAAQASEEARPRYQRFTHSEREGLEWLISLIEGRREPGKGASL